MNETLETLREIAKYLDKITGLTTPVVVTADSAVSQYSWLYKPANSPVTITEILNVEGLPYPSNLISFINDEVSEGVHFPLPFSKISVSSGSILVGKSNF